MKKILIVFIAISCIALASCSNGATTYELTEDDMETIYSRGYQEGYSDCSEYEVDLYEDGSAPQFFEKKEVKVPENMDVRIEDYVSDEYEEDE